MKKTILLFTLVASLVMSGFSMLAQVTVNDDDNSLGKLHVHDPVNQNASIYLTPMGTLGDSSMIFFAEDNNALYGMFWLYSGSGGDEMELWTSSYGSHIGPHFKVQRGTGNIAIGDIYATGYKLSVNGKIICTELRINALSGWPDYVFRKDYKLMTIKELEEFIEKNGHLPNAPPADEIEGSGLDVGEMQKVMMEKIEEMSLYIIQQQGRIEDLQEQLDAMKEN